MVVVVISAILILACKTVAVMHMWNVVIVDATGFESISFFDSFLFVFVYSILRTTLFSKDD